MYNMVLFMRIVSLALVVLCIAGCSHREVSGESYGKIARHNLSDIEARFNKGEIFYDDSTISATLDYFSGKVSGDSLASVGFYCGGLIYGELGDIDQSLYYYRMSLDRLHKNTPVALERAIHYGRANIYMREKMYKNSIEALEIVWDLTRQSCDTASIIVCAEALAKACALSGALDSASMFHEAACKLYIAKPDCKFIPEAVLSTVSYHTALKQYDRADALLNAMNPKVLPKRHRLEYFMESASVELAKCDTVSALHSLKWVVDSAALPEAYAASALMARLKPTREYVDHALCLSDSIRSVRGRGFEEVMSNVTFHKQERVSMKKVKREDIKITIFAFFSFLTPAIAVSLLIWVRSRRAALKKLRLRIGKMPLPVVERCDVVTDDVLVRLRARLRSSHKCSSKEWLAIEERLKDIAPEFYNFFYATTAISVNEQRVATLIKLGFPVKEIARIMCKSENGISTIKSRLSKKLWNDPKATARDLDRIIDSL